MPTALIMHLNFDAVALPTIISYNIEGAVLRDRPTISSESVIEGHKKRIPFNGILSSCGGRTRTCDLWVMSPTSYLCSTPRSFGTAKVVINFDSASLCSEKINFLAYI